MSYRTKEDWAALLIDYAMYTINAGQSEKNLINWARKRGFDLSTQARHKLTKPKAKKLLEIINETKDAKKVEEFLGIVLTDEMKDHIRESMGISLANNRVLSTHIPAPQTSHGIYKKYLLPHEEPDLVKVAAVNTLYDELDMLRIQLMRTLKRAKDEESGADNLVLAEVVKEPDEKGNFKVKAQIFRRIPVVDILDKVTGKLIRLSKEIRDHQAFLLEDNRKKDIIKFLSDVLERQKNGEITAYEAGTLLESFQIPLPETLKLKINQDMDKELLLEARTNELTTPDIEKLSKELEEQEKREHKKFRLFMGFKELPQK